MFAIVFYLLKSSGTTVFCLKTKILIIILSLCLYLIARRYLVLFYISIVFSLFLKLFYIEINNIFVLVIT